MNYEVVGESPARKRAKAQQAQKKKLSRQEKEDQVLSGALGSDWKDGPKSEYVQASHGDQHWLADAWDTFSKGPVHAFIGFSLGTFLFCMSFPMYAWTRSFFPGMFLFNRIMRTVPLFFTFFGFCLMLLGFIALIIGLSKKETREKCKPQTITSVIVGTAVMCLGTLGFFIWMIVSFVMSVNEQLEDEFADFVPDREPAKPYLQMLSERETNLTKKGAAPQEWRAFDKLKDGQKQISYESEGRQLKAIQIMPTNGETENLPVVIYLHEGFALDPEDIDVAMPFADAGYFVMLPSFRGENGNDGHFEMMHGEVDDAIAAVDWAKKQTFVDPDRIYVFGHSFAGGGIAALMSLHDIDVAITGSSGGLLAEFVFITLKQDMPFDLEDLWEQDVRLLLGHLSDMKIPHYVYIGHTDVDLKDEIDKAEWEIADNEKLRIKRVRGDHFTSLNPAIREFINLIGQGQLDVDVRHPDEVRLK